MIGDRVLHSTRNRYVPASINETAFNCLHCHALAKQTWHKCGAAGYAKDDTPFIPPIIFDEDSLSSDEFIERTETRLSDITDANMREKLSIWMKQFYLGRPFLSDDTSYHKIVPNLSISECYNCNKLSIWVHNKVVWPIRGGAPIANPDLPDVIRTDYDEASAILDLSPRGAAALLRQCIQKICGHVGESGKNINDDIAALVKKGLHRHLQQALDVVRVVGNNAVHPGQIDIRDDRATAEKLFNLVNLIAETLISQPKHVQEMYESLPGNALEAIDKRDSQL